MTDTYEATPNSGGYYHVNASYWANGLTETLNANFGSLPVWSYTPEVEGRLLTVTTPTGTWPLKSMQYSGFGILNHYFGNWDTTGYAYDTGTGRIDEYTFRVGPSGSQQTYGATLTWNANGTLQQQVISEPFNVGGWQTAWRLTSEQALKVIRFGV